MHVRALPPEALRPTPLSRPMIAPELPRVTWTSASSAPWCLPTLNCCQDTEITPLLGTRRLIQSSPIRRSASAVRSSAGPPTAERVARRSAGVQRPSDFLGPPDHVRCGLVSAGCARDHGAIEVSRVMLDASGQGSGGSFRPLLADLTSGGTDKGLDQLVAGLHLEQPVGDVDVDELPAVVLADTDLLPSGLAMST
jgi:hypothetical protein